MLHVSENVRKSFFDSLKDYKYFFEFDAEDSLFYNKENIVSVKNFYQNSILYIYNKKEKLKENLLMMESSLAKNKMKYEDKIKTHLKTISNKEEIIKKKFFENSDLCENIAELENEIKYQKQIIEKSSENRYENKKLRRIKEELDFKLLLTQLELNKIKEKTFGNVIEKTCEMIERKDYEKIEDCCHVNEIKPLITCIKNRIIVETKEEFENNYNLIISKKEMEKEELIQKNEELSSNYYGNKIKVEELNDLVKNLKEEIKKLNIKKSKKYIDVDQEIIDERNDILEKIKKIQKRIDDGTATQNAKKMIDKQYQYLEELYQENNLTEEDFIERVNYDYENDGVDNDYVDLLKENNKTLNEAMNILKENHKISLLEMEQKMATEIELKNKFGKELRNLSVLLESCKDVNTKLTEKLNVFEESKNLNENIIKEQDEKIMELITEKMKNELIIKNEKKKVENIVNELEIKLIEYEEFKVFYNENVKEYNRLIEKEKNSRMDSQKEHSKERKYWEEKIKMLKDDCDNLKIELEDRTDIVDELFKKIRELETIIEINNSLDNNFKRNLNDYWLYRKNKKGFMSRQRKIMQEHLNCTLCKKNTNVTRYFGYGLNEHFTRIITECCLNGLQFFDPFDCCQEIKHIHLIFLHYLNKKIPSKSIIWYRSRLSNVKKNDKMTINERFYKTYLSPVVNYGPIKEITYEEFCKIPDGQKRKKFFKYYKRLSKEIGTKLHYNVFTKKEMDDMKKEKRIRSEKIVDKYVRMISSRTSTNIVKEDRVIFGKYKKHSVIPYKYLLNNDYKRKYDEKEERRKIIRNEICNKVGNPTLL